MPSRHQPQEDELYALIHSLSKSEKRSFKLHIPYGEQGQCAELFDLLNSVKPYDAQEIERRLERCPWNKHVHVLRHTLYRHLLHSLAQGGSGRMQEYELHGQYALLLAKRGLWRRSRKELEQAKRHAQAAEQWAVLLQLLEQERRLLDHLFADDDIAHRQALQAVESQAALCLQRLQTIQHYRQLLSDIRALGQAAYQTEQIDPTSRAAALLQLPELQQPPQEALVTLHHFFYACRMQLFFMLGRTEEYQTDNNRYLNLWESCSVELQNLYPDYYQGVLYNSLLYHLHCGHAAEFEALAERLRGLLLRPEYGALYALIFVRLTGAELAFYSSNGNLKRALELLDRQLPELDRQLPLAPQRDAVSTDFVVARCWFYARRFRAAGNRFQDLMDRYTNSHRQDLLALARCLHALCLSELDEYERLESVCRSASRFFGRRGNLFQTPLLIIRQLPRLSSAPPSERPKLLRQLQEQIIDLHSRQPNEGRLNQFFDFVAWFKERLS